jgi:hypothetical protein
VLILSDESPYVSLDPSVCDEGVNETTDSKEHGGTS